eukprot:scaffold33147_cov43-Prasinocladus_malaysianus.AAC.1
MNTVCCGGAGVGGRKTGSTRKAAGAVQAQRVMEATTSPKSHLAERRGVAAAPRFLHDSPT